MYCHPNSLHNGAVIKKTELKTWIDRYKESIAQENKKSETKNIIIKLEDMEELMKFIKKHNDNTAKDKISGMRIYLIRTEHNSGHLKSGQFFNKVQLNAKSYPQMNVVIVPIKNVQDYAERDSSGKTNIYVRGEDVYEKNSNESPDEIVVGIYPGGETTGLCPNNCGGSQ